jgi:hypothetical protein
MNPQRVALLAVLVTAFAGLQAAAQRTDDVQGKSGQDPTAPALRRAVLAPQPTGADQRASASAARIVRLPGCSLPSRNACIAGP